MGIKFRILAPAKRSSALLIHATVEKHTEDKINGPHSHHHHQYHFVFHEMEKLVKELNTANTSCLKHSIL